MIPAQAISFLGLLKFVGIAYGLSENRKIISWWTVITGIVLQFIFAFLILKTDTGHDLFKWLGDIFNLLLVYTQQGSEFVFGNLAKPSGSWGFLFFTMVLPTIIVISSLMSVLYHLGIMQKVVKGMAYAMMKVMKISGAESLAAASIVFSKLMVPETGIPVTMNHFS